MKIMKRPNGGYSNKKDSYSDQDNNWIVVCLSKCIEVGLKKAERTVIMFASVLMKVECQA
jgi:hypothetical protein